MKIHIYFSTLLILILTGCASKPKLADHLVMPPVPNDEINLIESTINIKGSSNIEENVVQHPIHKVKAGSRVVINVPDGLFENRSKNTAKKQNFKTKDFFNVAEQQIEKELIRNGFRVLSRSKFEAKLRSLRDLSAQCDINRYNCLYSRTSPADQPILDELKKRYDKGEITLNVYSDQLNEFRRKSNVGSVGKSRNDSKRELTDISEVIRAAESGGIQADYILQINLFNVDNVTTIRNDLRHLPKVRSFIRQYPEIKNEFESGYNIIGCAASEAQLNAKLVHVKTGEISWIGEHSLNDYSAGVKNIIIEMGVKKYVSNQEAVRKFININNTTIARQVRYGEQVTIPEFKYRSVLLKPTVSSGQCNRTIVKNDTNQSQLARQVAKDLIRTIKVTK